MLFAEDRCHANSDAINQLFGQLEAQSAHAATASAGWPLMQRMSLASLGPVRFQVGGL
jgi:hypothetical protein